MLHKHLEHKFLTFELFWACLYSLKSNTGSGRVRAYIFRLDLDRV